MHAITVVFGPAATTWRLLFKSEEAFNVAAAALKNPALDVALLNGTTKTIVNITDDYSQNFYAPTDQIHGVLFENLDQSRQAVIESALHQARTQVATQNAGMADPMLKHAATMSRGPAVIGQVPGMSNGYGN